jgi:hypothetical protein
VALALFVASAVRPGSGEELLTGVMPVEFFVSLQGKDGWPLDKCQT